MFLLIITTRYRALFICLSVHSDYWHFPNIDLFLSLFLAKHSFLKFFFSFTLSVWIRKRSAPALLFSPNIRWIFLTTTGGVFALNYTKIQMNLSKWSNKPSTYKVITSENESPRLCLFFIFSQQFERLLPVLKCRCKNCTELVERLCYDFMAWRGCVWCAHGIALGSWIIECAHFPSVCLAGRSYTLAPSSHAEHTLSRLMWSRSKWEPSGSFPFTSAL